MGPRGEGPRTGRGLGFCSGSDRPGFQVASPGTGRGLGRRRGGGLRRGVGRDAVQDGGAYSPAPSLAEEVALLRDQIQELAARLATLSPRD